MTTYFCSLASGSSGNCHFLTNEEEHLLIDAGLSGKKIQGRLQEVGFDAKSITGILVSHEHNDHICGVGVLSRRFNVPIYANEATWEAMKDKIGNIASENIKLFETEKPFFIGKLKVLAYSTSHDAAEPVGFTFESSHAKISVATDLGFVNKGIIDKIKNSNLVVLEANHDEDMLKAGSYPYYLKRRILSDIGHLSNEAAGNAIVDLVKKDVKNVLLAHLSKENNFPELAMITVKGILQRHEINIGEDVSIDLAYRDKASTVYAFEG
ncbi:metal-dependent hydrolase, beta-lactamase superfamily I [Clostridium aceticum]|uniref:Metal-dependent hydrolase, beta-lactamase superfamily I n=1 Tax=Clostridium aceticum TaxID=84022 RepID=A0A0D8I8K3_9CLOT|nr:MBL fold metallo-hydrolase [Clostridium aceticum]AKL97330.1 metal-dependent hydrolase, beta-lactamase superfamily I [Clostridium aceticum]KJF26342.1 metallohydrolase [Clostridium aceticum]